MALSRIKVWGAEVLTYADLNAEFNNILNNPTSLISPLTANLDGDGFSIVDLGGLIVGRTASAVTAGSAHGTQLLGTSAATTGAVIGMFSADAVAPTIAFAKSRNAAIGSHTIVQSGDDIGAITAYGSDGTDFEPAAQILFECAGTPGNNDMPGRIVFKTTPDGSVTLTTALTIGSNQILTTADFMAIGVLGNGGFNCSQFQAWHRQGSATATDYAFYIQHDATSGDNLFLNFATEVTPSIRGTIDYNRGGGAVRYNTSSGAELKNIFGDAAPDKSISILRGAKVKEFAWKDDPTQKPQLGFVAQELAEVYHGAVTRGGEVELEREVEVEVIDIAKAEKRKEKRIEKYIENRPWLVDKTAFQQHLVIGWQEHERVIAELRAELAAVKAKLP